MTGDVIFIYLILSYKVTHLFESRIVKSKNLNLNTLIIRGTHHRRISSVFIHKFYQEHVFPFEDIFQKLRFYLRQYYHMGFIAFLRFDLFENRDDLYKVCNK